MSDIVLAAQQRNVGRSADGAKVKQRALRDGAAIIAPWETALALEGKVFTANIGVGASTVTGDATWAATTPDVYIQVPASIAIIPLAIDIHLATMIDDVDLDAFFMASSILDTTPTAGTTVTPVNHLINSGISSSCAVTSDNSGLDDPTTGNYIEFARIATEFGAAPTFAATEDGQSLSYKWSATNNGPPPIINGTGALLGWVTMGGSTSAYYCKVTWAELPIGAV